MPWDAGASMDRLQRTLQSLREMKQRRREQGWNIVSDLLGKTIDVGKTWYEGKQADKRQLSAQEAAKELEYLRQGGDLTRLTTEYGLRGGEMGKEYDLRAGEEAKKYENLFPLWDQIFPGLSREQQLAKWSYWQGMSRPSDSAKDPQAESQWTSAADIAAKEAIAQRFADPEKWPSSAQFWSAVSQDLNLKSQVKSLYRTEADKYLRDYIKDKAAREIAVNMLASDFDVFINSGGISADASPASAPESTPGAVKPTPVPAPRPAAPPRSAATSPSEVGIQDQMQLAEDVRSAIEKIRGIASQAELKRLLDSASTDLGTGRVTTKEQVDAIMALISRVNALSSPSGVRPSGKEASILGLPEGSF